VTRYRSNSQVTPVSATVGFRYGFLCSSCWGLGIDGNSSVMSRTVILVRSVFPIGFGFEKNLPPRWRTGTGIGRFPSKRGGLGAILSPENSLLPSLLLRIYMACFLHNSIKESFSRTPDSAGPALFCSDFAVFSFERRDRKLNGNDTIFVQ
jgi:hypothetical protein